MFGQGFNSGFFGGPPCFTDTTDIFKDNSGVALYTLDYDASDSGNATGKFGEGAVFNGSSSRIDISNVLSGFTNVYSFSIWAKIDNTNNFSFLASTTSTSSSTYNNLIRFALHQNGNYYFEFGDVYGARLTGATPSNWRNGNWHHFVFVSTGTDKLVYVDGSLFDSTSSTKAVSGLSNVILGHYGTNYSDGLIDQVRVFNRGISSSEVTTLYNETKNTTNTLQILGDTSCIATYPLDGSSTDLSGNYDGTDANILYKYDGSPTNVDFGIGGKTLYGARFNGSSGYIDLGTSLLGSRSAFSVSTWVNFDNLNTQNFIFWNSESGTGSELGFYDYGNGNIYFQPDASTSSNRGYISNSGIYTTDEWVHIVMVFDGSETGNSNRLKAYIQGTERTLNYDGVIPSSTGTSTTNSWIGGRIATKLAGSIDQVRIFSKALSSAEVGKLYGNGAGEIACKYTATTTDIDYPIANTAYYKLDNNSKDSGKSRGKFNQGVTFIGNSAGIVNTTLQLSSTAHSVSLWMKPQDLTASKWQIMFFSAFNGHPSFTLGKRPDQTTSFHYRNESSNEVYFTLSNANTWYHVVVTRNNSGSTVYVNGSSVATDSNSMGSYSSSSYQKASIGSNPNYPAEYFDGTLDQIRVYNVALTATDVANLYNNETTATADTLAFPTGKTAIATYKLDGNGVDISGNYSGSEGDNIVYAYDGTESNIEYRFGRFGQAAVFNGSSSRIDLPNFFGITDSANFSASLWFNSNSTSNQSLFWANGSGAVARFGIGINNSSYGGAGAVYFGCGLSSFIYINSSGGAFNQNEWVHITVVKSSTTGMTLYVNGTQVANNSSATGNASLTATGSNSIGVYKTGSYSSWSNGSIDQVRIFGSALTSSQVTELYNEKPEVDTSNFKAVLYEGNGGSQYISNVGFEPDLVWIKERTGSAWHILTDSVRGANKTIYSNDTYQEESLTNVMNSFESNGFMVAHNSAYSSVFSNRNNEDYVAWVWKGGGDAAPNTQGTITSQVSANTDAGFSIVKYTADGSASMTVGHGLSQSPEIVISKRLDSSQDWGVYTNVSTGNNTTNWLSLNDADAYGSGSFMTLSSTLLSAVAIGAFWTQGSQIAYCFHSVAGYSKISSYAGSGASGKEVALDFSPSFVMIKRTNAAAGWVIIDDQRGSKELYPHAANAEDASTTNIVLGTNKFTLNTAGSWYNASGGNYLYMAFK